MSKYKLIYKGKDYSRIPKYPYDDFNGFVEIRDDCDNVLTDFNEFPLKEQLTDILISFLDSFDERTLSFVYKNIDELDEAEEKKKKKKLYTANTDGSMSFNGQIGFLRKQNFEYNVLKENEMRVEVQRHTFDITLRCTSRFDDERNYFLCSMLLRSDLSFVDSLVSVDDNDDVFEYMLLFRFVHLLRESFVKGFYKKYVTFQRNDDLLKGNIDFSRHLRLNNGYDNGKIAYSYRENTIKNPLNMLILETYKKLKNKFSDIFDLCFSKDDEELINSLSSEIGFIECSLPELIKLNTKPIFHPYYFEYESLREICLKILQDEGLNLYSQEEMYETNGFLVYVPNLWENYLQYHLEQMTNVFVSSQYRQDIAYSKVDGSSALSIRPDFVFFKNEQKTLPYAMMDAKFIPKWSDAIKRNELSKVSADFNKCIRDMTCLEIHKTGVIFPCREDTTFKEYSITINKKDTFVALGISIPSSMKFDTFVLWNDSFEKQVQSQLKDVLIPTLYDD